MPSTYLRDVEGDGPYSYNVSMFFWFFEARVDPQEAPTAIYLAGGPGQSSMFGAASDGGPCYVGKRTNRCCPRLGTKTGTDTSPPSHVGADSNSTYNNEWSMNTYVNMLYVDQPVGAGFSYDTLVSCAMPVQHEPSNRSEGQQHIRRSFPRSGGNQRYRHRPVRSVQRRRSYGERYVSLWNASKSGPPTHREHDCARRAHLVALLAGVVLCVSRVEDLQERGHDLG